MAAHGPSGAHGPGRTAWSAERAGRAGPAPPQIARAHLETPAWGQDTSSVSVGVRDGYGPRPQITAFSLFVCRGW